MLRARNCAKPHPAAVAAALIRPRPFDAVCTPVAAHMAQTRKLKLPIPVTIITGALGVGKTTSICSLLQRKPLNEVWCVIVNEFGAVGIDQIAIEASCAQGTSVVKQIAGGCMCCVLSGPLCAAIAQIIRQAKPDRVIIEPSGLGHPGGLIDVLQGPHLCTSLQLNAVICLVDLSSFNPVALMDHDTTAAQITVADVLVGNKADAAAAGAAEAFQQWAADDLFPPKQEVLTTRQGKLDSCWLDAPRAAASGRLSIKASSQSSRARQQQQLQATALARQQQQLPWETAQQQEQQGPSASDQPAASAAGPRQPLRVAGWGLQAGPHCSCGWVFDQQDIFDQVLLLQLLQDLQPLVARVKGVFRVGKKQWVLPVQAVVQKEQQQRQCDPSGTMQEVEQFRQPGSTKGNDNVSSQQLQLQLVPICYRGPSMVEIIITSGSAINPSSPDGMLNDAVAVECQLQRTLNCFLADRNAENQSCKNSSAKECAAAAAADAAASFQELSVKDVNESANPLSDSLDLLDKALVHCLQQ